MNGPDEPTLSFDCDFDENDAADIEQKGYFQHAIANLPDGRRVRLSFWDPVRLSQDLETEKAQGRICIAEPGLIVVPDVTVENMLTAIKEIYRRGYFDRILSIFG
jgi:hypothetical protein